MIEKIYKTAFWIFLIESILLLIGISLDLVSYGVDVQTPFMGIGILFALIVGTAFRFFLRKFDSNFKDGAGVILSIIMAFLCLYYLLEDHFEILL